MTVIIALDNRSGYTRSGKHLSRDRAMLDDLAEYGTIYASPYTAAILGNHPVNVVTPIPEHIPVNAVLFLETEDIPDTADKLIVYRWDKHYPCDRIYEPSDHGWKLGNTSDFPGYSHEIIIKEEWIK